MPLLPACRPLGSYRVADQIESAEREYFYGYAVGRDLFAQVRMAAFNASAARLLRL
jgi:hypothetical protein